VKPFRFLVSSSTAAQNTGNLVIISESISERLMLLSLVVFLDGVLALTYFLLVLLEL